MHKLSKIKPALSLLLKLIIGIVIGTVLMISVYCIPISPIEKHVKNSAEVFESEGGYPQFLSQHGIGGRGYCNSIRDNVTDAFMLLIASYNPALEKSVKDQNQSTLALSMLNIRYGKPSDPVQSLIDHYKYGKPFDEKIMYGRYWNGYLSYLKPLLYVFDYITIRYINIAFQIIIFIIVLLFLKRKGLKSFIPSYVLCILMAMPLAVVLNIQLSHCFTIFNIGIIAMLLNKDHIEERVCSILLILGMVTSFIDLLTYPLVTFGIPAVIYFTMTKTDSIKQMFLKVVKTGLSWGVGYGGMWIGKWIVGSVLSGQNIFANGLDEAALRVNSAAERASTVHFTIFRTVSRNIGSFIFTPITIIVAIYVLILLIQIIRMLKGRMKEKNVRNELFIISIPFLIIMILPIIWFIALRNHSASHAYLFVNKELLMSAMAIMFWMMRLYKWSKELKQKNETEGDNLASSLEEVSA